MDVCSNRSRRTAKRVAPVWVWRSFAAWSQDHGGTVTLDSEPGRTSFIITIPQQGGYRRYACRTLGLPQRTGLIYVMGSQRTKRSLAQRALRLLYNEYRVRSRVGPSILFRPIGSSQSSQIPNSPSSIFLMAFSIFCKKEALSAARGEK